jgi:LPXTG-motif cell wall-anchored protein
MQRRNLTLACALTLTGALGLLTGTAGAGGHYDDHSATDETECSGYDCQPVEATTTTGPCTTTTTEETTATTSTPEETTTVPETTTTTEATMVATPAPPAAAVGSERAGEATTTPAPVVVVSGPEGEGAGTAAAPTPPAPRPVVMAEVANRQLAVTGANASTPWAVVGGVAAIASGVALLALRRRMVR